MKIASIKELIKRWRERILKEVLEVEGLMHLLMKVRNNRGRWSRDEIREIKNHLKEISKTIPALFVFLLPGCSILLLILAAILDRRKTKRTTKNKIVC